MSLQRGLASMARVVLARGGMAEDGQTPVPLGTHDPSAMSKHRGTDGFSHPFEQLG